MHIEEIVHEIRLKKSYLCVGLDTDAAKIPTHLHRNADPVFEFNKQIIDATLPYTVAYKINTAFYECMGANGWHSLKKTLDYIPKNIFKIADAKRADIGNTAQMYAKTFFEIYDFDAVTLHPYMGSDSIYPFLQYPGKWAIILALTSNEGSKDFEELSLQSGEKLYEIVLKTSSRWGSHHNTMYVAGATKANVISEIRNIVPEHFLLVPGVGAQGGSLQAVSAHGLNANVGLLVNSSRTIIYASFGENFATDAANAAAALQHEMSTYLK